jgi:phage terminase small subunit
MALTAKQEAFCQAIVLGASQADAYRKAYDAERMKAETVQNKAHVLMKNGEVRARVEALRAPVIEELQVTLAQHLRDLKEMRDSAKTDAKWGPAIVAEIARGKASGLYVEHLKIDATVKGSVAYKANMPTRS